MSQSTTVADERPLNWPALCEVALLALVAALLLTKVARGVLAFYIHPRYTPLVVGCAIILLCIAGVRMRAVFQARPERFAGRGVVYMLLLVPLLFGIVVPAAPLGADNAWRARPEQLQRRGDTLGRAKERRDDDLEFA